MYTSGRKHIMKVFNKDKFGKLIEDSGLTIVEIAGKLGFSAKQLIAWKAGEAEPRAETLVIIARFFNVSVDWMLDLSAEQHGQLSSGEKSLTTQEKEFVDAFRRGDLQTAMTIFMQKLNKQLEKRNSK